MPDHNPAETLTAAAKRLTDAVEYFDGVAITRPAALVLAELLNEVAECVTDDLGIIQDSTTDAAHRLAQALLGEATE